MADSAAGGFLIAQAYVQVNPLMTGFGPKLTAELMGQMKVAGAAGGSVLGAGVKKGAAEAETSVKSLTTRMGEFGKATLATGGPLKAFAGLAAGLFVIKGLKDAISDAREFQVRMVDMVTGAGELQSNLGMVSSGILKMSGDLGVSAINLEKGLYTIESDGYHGAAGLNILHAAAEGARTGMADMETVAQSVMTVMRSYEIPANQATQATSMLVEAVAHGGVRMNDLAQGMKTVAPIASALHVPVTQLYGAMSTMTSVTHDASTAATGLRYVLNSLASPAGPARDAMKSVGLSADQVANTLQGPGHLIGALQLVEKHIGETFPGDAAKQITALHDIVGGTRGMSAALQLTGPHMTEFIANTKAIGAASNGAGKDVNGWSSVNKTLDFQIAQIKAKTGAWAIVIGTALIPALTDTLKALQGVASAAIDSAKWLDHHRVVIVALGLALVALKWQAIISGFETIAIKAMYAGDAIKAFAISSTEGIAAVNPIAAGVVVGLGLLAAAVIYLGGANKKAKEDIDNLTKALTQQAGQSNADYFVQIAKAVQPYREELQKAGVDTTKFTADLAAGGPRAAKALADASKAGQDLNATLHESTHHAEAMAPEVKTLETGLSHLGTALKNVQNDQAKNNEITDLATKAMHGQSDILGPVAKALDAVDKAQTAFQAPLSAANKELTAQNDLLADNRNQAKLTAGALQSIISDNLKQISQENLNIAKLQKEGLNPGLLKELIDKGPQYVAAAASMSKQSIKQMTTDWTQGLSAAGERAKTLAQIEAPKPYQAMVDAEKRYEASLTTANRRAFTDTVQTALKHANDIANRQGGDVPKTIAGKVTTLNNVMLDAYLKTLSGPVRTAVQIAIQNGSDGGKQLTQNWANAITAGKGTVANAAYGTAAAIQKAINSVQGKTVTIQVAADLYGLTAVEYALQKAHYANSPAATHYAAGGPVVGGTPGKDSVPGILMPGEWVLRKPDVDALGGPSGVESMLHTVGVRNARYQDSPAPARGGTPAPATAGHSAGVTNYFTINMDKSMSNTEMVADMQRRLALAVAA